MREQSRERSLWRCHKWLLLTKQMVHCRLVLPLPDVPEVLAVSTHEEVGFTRKQEGVHVPDTKTVTFGTLCSGRHGDHLRGETLVIPSRTVLRRFQKREVAEAYHPKLGQWFAHRTADSASAVRVGGRAPARRSALVSACMRGLSSPASGFAGCPTQCALLVRLSPWAPSTSNRMRGI